MNEMIQVSVLFFAHIKELAGIDRLELSVPEGTSVKKLQQSLIDENPMLRNAFENVIVSVNREFATPDQVLDEGSEIALFPPVSGGGDANTLIKITLDEFSIDETINAMVTETTGGLALFIGIVRCKSASENVTRITPELYYEAYESMAYEKMAQIAMEIRERWSTVERIALIQRIGKLSAGTPAALIACSASHRDTGIFDAARYGIDRLKEIAPIWKKELSENGEIWVEGNYYPKPSD